MRVSELTQGNYHKASRSIVCNVGFFFFVSCYACYPGKLLYEQTAMNFSTSTFSNDRNNLIIFSLTSYHILEDQSWLLLSEDLDYEVSMEPKQSHRCLIF